MSAESLQESCRRFHAADKALRDAGSENIEETAETYLRAQRAHQEAIERERKGGVDVPRSRYVVEMSVRDARGKKFGGRIEVDPEKFADQVTEMARAVVDFTDASHLREDRQRYGFERIGGEDG